MQYHVKETPTRQIHTASSWLYRAATDLVNSAQLVYTYKETQRSNATRRLGEKNIAPPTTISLDEVLSSPYQGSIYCEFLHLNKQKSPPPLLKFIYSPFPNAPTTFLLLLNDASTAASVIFGTRDRNSKSSARFCFVFHRLIIRNYFSSTMILC